MTALLIVALFGIALLVYDAMRRIDRFIEKGGLADSPQGRANRGILVFGSLEAADKFKHVGLRFRVLHQPIFPEDGCYSALFSLSANDDENLILCCAAKRSDPGIYLIVRCNSPQLHSIFETIGANCILNAGECIDTLLEELGGITK